MPSMFFDRQGALATTTTAACSEYIMLKKADFSNVTKTSSRLSHLAVNDEVGENSWRRILGDRNQVSLEIERNIRRRRLFTSSIKRPIRKFHVLAVQCQRNVSLTEKV